MKKEKIVLIKVGPEMIFALTDQGRILTSRISDGKWVEWQLPSYDIDGFYDCDKSFLENVDN